MHKVILAKSAGFCFGVKRAVEMAVAALDQGNLPVYTLGPIIHNPQEVDRLQEMGIRMARGLEEISEGTVVIRSHGAPMGVIEEAELRGLTVVDATCPLVNCLKERVRQLAENGYQVIIVGESDHPEVKAVVSYDPDSCLVTRGIDELDPSRFGKKVGVVAQTTQSLSTLQSVASACISRCRETRVYNTICIATHKRSAEALELSRNVDVMVIVGGKNSANTTRLARELAWDGSTTYHIESAEEIGDLQIGDGAVIGITAGASTPGWVITEVVEALENLD
ncbi:MAG: 4-hydroxy-3-methylbut-2-enyl diphosphate reductase [bacterium]|nr:4-hydroxy-3-methylbut-2-enyl diphosphate reductase [bacterium]MDT8395718.1 4-hydroxy-3-methylbut-2-enyl diphosphate reductase [bacterium]